MLRKTQNNFIIKNSDQCFPLILQSKKITMPPSKAMTIAFNNWTKVNTKPFQVTAPLNGARHFSKNSNKTYECKKYNG